MVSAIHWKHDVARSLEDVTSTSFSSRPSICHTVGLRISRSNQSLTVPALNQRSRPKEGILASKPSVTIWYVEPRLPEKRCKSRSPRPTLDFDRIAITILDRISIWSGPQGQFFDLRKPSASRIICLKRVVCHWLFP